MNMKTVLVFDTTPSRRDAHCRALVDLGHAVFRCKNLVVEAYPPSTTTAPTTYDLILLHANDESAFSTCHSSGPVLRYGGSEIVERGRISRAVLPEHPLSKDEMTAIIAALDVVHPVTFEDAIAGIWSAVPENLLSWALIEKYGGGGITADASLVSTATTELRQRSGYANAALTLENVEKVIAEYRADF